MFNPIDTYIPLYVFISSHSEVLNYPYPYTLRPNPYHTLPSLLLFFTFLPMVLHGYREHGVTT